MQEITSNDKLFFFEKHFFTLDGLWMIETEKKIGWEKALEIDLSVWVKLLKIIFRRLINYLSIRSNSLPDLIKLLTFRWAVEGWKYEVKYTDDGKFIIKVNVCPYKSAMDRNPERHEKIPLICKNMCKPFYKKIIHDFNPKISINRDEFMGLGGEFCDFQLSSPDLKPVDMNDLIYTDITIQNNDKLFYFERNFRTLDGLWVIEVENKLDFKTALALDIIVWQKLYQIVFRRVKKRLNIEGNSLNNLISILSFVWNCEGNKHEIIEKDTKKVLIKINKCPYIEAMQRNPERDEKIEAICKKMCIPYLEPIIKEFNPKINLVRTKFIGIGDNYCDFQLFLKS